MSNRAFTGIRAQFGENFSIEGRNSFALSRKNYVQKIYNSTNKLYSIRFSESDNGEKKIWLYYNGHKVSQIHNNVEYLACLRIVSLDMAQMVEKIENSFQNRGLKRHNPVEFFRVHEGCTPSISRCTIYELKRLYTSDFHDARAELRDMKKRRQRQLALAKKRRIQKKREKKANFNMKFADKFLKIQKNIWYTEYNVRKLIADRNERFSVRAAIKSRLKKLRALKTDLSMLAEKR
jgi:transposase